MKNVFLNKKMMNTFKNRKYQITVLKHINPDNTSVSSHYRCDKYVDGIDRSYIFFESSCNDIVSPVLWMDMCLGICVINDPISFKTLMKCFSENAYYFLKRKYSENN